MTRNELKKYLSSYRALRTELRQLKDEIIECETLMQSPTGGGRIDGMPHGAGSGDPVSSLALRHVELYSRYMEKITAVVFALSEIEEVISLIDEERLRVLIRYRYIDCLKWEDVCDKMCYSWRQTHNLHLQALDKLIAKMEPRS